MCVGCGRRDDQAVLVRYVARVEEGVAHVSPDPDRRADGRGAYLHDDPACVDRALRRKALQRTLRIPASVPAELGVGQPAPQRDETVFESESGM